MEWEQIGALAARAQGGDKASYKEFLSLVCRGYKARFSRLLPAANVDDAVQEFLLAIHKALHTYDSSKPIAPWLNAIAHYKVQDQLRSLYRLSVNVEYLDQQHGLATEQSYSTDIQKYLSKLPDRESKLLYLLKVEELSVAEVAAQMSMSVSNVKVSSFRALKKLRELLVEEEFNEK